MGNSTTHPGTVTERDNPEWSPLVDLLGAELASCFMWMYEVELGSGVRLQAYKHRDTRRYVHLDPASVAFAYESPGHYRDTPVAELLAAVFAPLVGLAGVSARQIADSWAAVARLDEDLVPHVEHMH